LDGSSAGNVTFVIQAEVATKFTDDGGLAVIGLLFHWIT
jgi:hypothetical protein